MSVINRSSDMTNSCGTGAAECFVALAFHLLIS